MQVLKEEYGIDPEEFVAYYEARDWKLAAKKGNENQKMRSWEATCKTWEIKRKKSLNEKQKTKNPLNTFGWDDDDSSLDWIVKAKADGMSQWQIDEELERMRTTKRRNP